MEKSRLTILKKCRNCEWAFSENQGDGIYTKDWLNKKTGEECKKGEHYYKDSKTKICVGNSGVYKYGEVIKDLNNKCDSWEIGFDYFCILSKKLEENRNVEMVRKAELILGNDFQIIGKCIFCRRYKGIVFKEENFKYYICNDCIKENNDLGEIFEVKEGKWMDVRCGVGNRLIATIFPKSSIGYWNKEKCKV
jgi:hypothetical protein